MQNPQALARHNATAPEVLRIRVHEVHVEPLPKAYFDYDVRVHAEVEVKEVIRSAKNLKSGQTLVLKYQACSGLARHIGSNPPRPLRAGEELTAFLGTRSDGYLAPLCGSALLRNWRQSKEWNPESFSLAEHPLLKPRDLLVPTVEELIADVEQYRARLRRKELWKKRIVQLLSAVLPGAIAGALAQLFSR